MAFRLKSSKWPCAIWFNNSINLSKYLKDPSDLLSFEKVKFPQTSKLIL